MCFLNFKMKKKKMFILWSAEYLLKYHFLIFGQIFSFHKNISNPEVLDLLRLKLNECLLNLFHRRTASALCHILINWTFNIYLFLIRHTININTVKFSLKKKENEKLCNMCDMTFIIINFTIVNWEYWIKIK